MYDEKPDPDEDWKYPNYNFDIYINQEIYMDIIGKQSTGEEFIEQINCYVQR